MQKIKYFFLASMIGGSFMFAANAEAAAVSCAKHTGMGTYIQCGPTLEVGAAILQNVTSRGNVASGRTTMFIQNDGIERFTYNTTSYSMTMMAGDKTWRIGDQTWTANFQMGDITGLTETTPSPSPSPSPTAAPGAASLGSYISTASESIASTTGFTVGSVVTWTADNFVKIVIGSGLAMLLSLRYWILALVIIGAIVYFGYRAFSFFRH